MPLIAHKAENDLAAGVLRASEAQYRLLFSASPQPMWVFDRKTFRFLEVNEAAVRQYGYSREEFLRMTFPDICPAEDIPRLREYLAVTRNGLNWAGIWRHGKKDGILMQVEIAWRAITFAGRPAGLVLVRDIAARKHAEDALRESEARCRTLFEESREAIYVIGRDGKVLDANRAALNLLGCAREQAIGRNLLRTYANPADLAEFQRLLEQKGLVRDYELKLRRKDGTEIDCLVTATLWRDAEGHILGYQAIVRDITETKRTEREPAGLLAGEQAARAEAEMLRAASLALSQALSLDTVLESLLDYLRQLVPYDSASVMLLEGDLRLSLRVRWTRGYEASGDANRARAISFDAGRNAILRTLLTTAKSVLIADTKEDPHWERTAGSKPVRSWLGVPLVAGGKVLGLMGLDKSEPSFFTQEHVRLAEALVPHAAAAIHNAQLYERAERHAAELEKRIQALKQAEASLRRLSGRLLHLQDEERRRISRELHDSTAQALAGLAMNLSLLSDRVSALDPAARRALAESLALTEQCAREIRTVSYLLHPPLLEEVGLASALRWYAEGFTKRSGIRVELDMPPELGPLPRDVEIALFRVAQESLANVHRHADSATACIRLVRSRAEILLEISDQGRGILPGVLEKSAGGGAGLGVGIAGMWERVTQLGGQLTVSSTGQGTTVRATLPVPAQSS